MKYGETSFDIIYLILAILFSTYIIVKRKNKAHLLMGIAILVLAFGDAFHLIPRILNYFVPSESVNVALGVGKFITSITMTIFYVLLYHVYIEQFDVKPNKVLTIIFYVLFAIRIALLIPPQNGWFTNENNLILGIVRNIPFFVMGVITIVLFFQKRNVYKILWPMWLYITLSFAFYIPVVVGTEFVPMLGMFMIPKTVCYLVMFGTYAVFVRKGIDNTKQIETQE